METYRLKNIAIVILLLLNLCLLLLLGYQGLRERQAARQTAEELERLCQANQLTLGAEVDLGQEALSPLALTRRGEQEQAIASYLLQGEAVSASQGGDIYSYEAGSRAIQFRAGGSFYGSRMDLPVEDIPDFVQTFCRQFGYEEPRLELEDGTGTAAAIQRLGGVPVVDCEIVMYFEDGALISVTGAHVSMEAASAEAGEQLGCVTALVKFLNYRSVSGAVCSEVAGVRCVYQLQGGAAPRLRPAWEIQTDTYTYYVDCETGEVSGK